MKSAREAMIRGGPASVERALMDAAPAIAEALRDPRWLPPPPPLSLFCDGDNANATTSASGSYAPPADQAEAYRALEAPVRRLRLAREACTALGIGRGRRGGVDETEEDNNNGGGANDDGGDDNSGVPLSLAVRVYEASADAAAAMLSADGELLKALSGLCGSIYPALRRQQREQEKATSAPASAALVREGEMRAALVLFYACMPARPLPQNLTQCLSAFLQQQQDQEEPSRDRRLLQTALRGASAALSGDWVSFGSCYAMMPRLPRHVMARCLPRMRAQAVRCMARCFAPSLPVAVAERWLGLRVVKSGNDKHGPLVSLLEDAARDGCKGSAAALAAREQARRKRADAVWSAEGGGGDSWEERAEAQDDDDGDGFVDLVFKPPPTPSSAAIAAAAANKS
jgi:hypothetical protein